jgi:apolipoprotein N-acyltransferase
LLWLSYFPVACGWLAWFALVPLLALVRARQSFRCLFLCAWLSGLAFFVPALWWMHAADGLRSAPLSLGPMTAASYMLSIYCALYFAAAILLVRRLDTHTRLPLTLTLPAVWVGLEFLRASLGKSAPWSGTGFPWYFLSHSQHAFLEMIQVADLGGAYTVTLLVAGVNALVFEWIYTSPWLRDRLGLREPNSGPLWRGRVLQTVLAAGVLLAALMYGSWRLDQNDFQRGPRLALLQGNLEQRLRNEATAGNDDTAPRAIYRHYGSLCKHAARLQPELIVWPETSFPSSWIETAQEVPYAAVPPAWVEVHVAIREGLRDLAGQCHTNLLLGLNTLVLTDRRKLLEDGGKGVLDSTKDRVKYNSALRVTAAGTPGGRYDKIRRVPFGEYIPLREWLPIMNAFSPYSFEYSISQGNKLTRFELGPYHFGVLICFEDSDPDLARRYGVASADGPPADFLVNISNDGWFDGTAEHEEHLAVSRFRAIEARRSIARSVNMGISAVIDGNGRVLLPQLVGYDGNPKIWDIPWGPAPAPTLPSDAWGRFKKVEGVLLATVPIDHRTSLYALWGDWLPWGCWLLVGGGLALVWFRRRNVKASGAASARQ